MSLKKFGDKDIIQNTMRSFPRVKFFIYDSDIFYNDEPPLSGSRATFVKVVPPGHISLHEYNIDRIIDTGIAAEPSTAKSIYPFITKQSQGAAFATVSANSYSTDFVYGDVMTSSYPLSASISRDYFAEAGQRDNLINQETGEVLANAGPPVNPRYIALRNRLDFYGALSEHYRISGSTRPDGYNSSGVLTERAGWNKDKQTINLISIPSIFYGTKIDPGTVCLKWYFSGSLIGELQDIKQNGELIQTGPPNSVGSGSVAGVVLYNEGFLLMTGSWDLGDGAPAIGLLSDGSLVKPKWIYYGAGANDGMDRSVGGTTFTSASFGMTFRGQTDTQVITMFAHAQKGMVNISNNPTYIKQGQNKVLSSTSSYIYEENPDRVIANVVSSSFHGHDAEYKRQVYISRIAIYDKNRKLIGLATLANPILKSEEDSYSFKIKLDI